MKDLLVGCCHSSLLYMLLVLFNTQQARVPWPHLHKTLSNNLSRWYWRNLRSKSVVRVSCHPVHLRPRVACECPEPSICAVAVLSTYCRVSKFAPIFLLTPCSWHVSLHHLICMSSAESKTSNLENNFEVLNCCNRQAKSLESVIMKFENNAELLQQTINSQCMTQ